MPPFQQTVASSGRSNREKVPSGGGAWKLLTFMIFVFAVFMFSYLGLVFGYKNFVKAQIEDRDAEIKELAAQVPKEQQDEFLKFQFQLMNLQTVLNKHVIGSKILPLLENNTHQQVFYKNLSINVADGRLDLDAVAASYDVLTQQLSAYELMPDLIRYQIGAIKIGEGGRIDFNVLLFLNTRVFQQQ